MKAHHPKLFKLLTLSLMGYLIVINGYSQKIIKGVVLEESSKGNFTPITGAPVVWLGMSSGVVTDTNGVFMIPVNEHIAMGHAEAKLVVSYLGYKSDTIDVKDMDKIRVILAQEGAKELQEVEVTERINSSYLNALDPMNTKSMSEKELFKAACCNLSESFETNPSVDVSFQDAVSGAKQIQMLGLSGIYSQLTNENLPGTRGLASSFGLGYVPGPWIESIQVTKGAGSVANGYESMTGQINVELKKTDVSTKVGERMYANVYANEMGRAEANLNLTQKLSPKWGTTLLTHVNQMGTLTTMHTDRNKDGFYDIPNGYQFNGINRWKYENNGWIAQFGIKALKDVRTAGQIPGMEMAGMPLYKIELNTERVEAFGKLGYVFPAKKYASIGLMGSAVMHNQDNSFGTRNYTGKQNSAYFNFIYQSIISNTNHKYRAGLSFLADNFKERYQSQGVWNMNRTEIVPGAFAEYTWTLPPRLSVVLGLRGDYHNLFGFFATPRIHAKYDITETTQLRFSAGRGQRTASPLAENTGALASSRAISIGNTALNTLNPIPFGNSNLSLSDYKSYGLRPEVSWNYGLSLSQDFTLDYRKGNIIVDFYRTDFQNQVVVDYDADPQQLRFYNLQGKSYSNSFQAEVNYELIRRLDVRLAYRYYDIKTNYHGEMLQRPLISQDRAFINLAYETRSKFKFDLTVNWNGRKRIPNPQNNGYQYQSIGYSPDFVNVNAQISKSFGKPTKQWWDVYIGVENLTDYRQKDLIIAPNNPFAANFDASLVWGPIIGRMTYVGARFKIK